MKETTLNLDLLRELLDIVFNKDWEISQKTTMSGLSDTKRRNVTIRIVLWDDKKLVNYAQSSFELNEEIEGILRQQLLLRLGEMRNDPTVTKNQMRKKQQIS